MLVFFTKLNHKDFWVKYLAYFWFLSKKQLWVVLDGKFSQEYPVGYLQEYVGVPQGFILGTTLFLIYINDLPDYVICAHDTTLYSKCDQASELWQQLELSSEFESDLHDTVDQGRKWFVDFNGGKTQLVLFDQSNSTVAIDEKVGGSVEERSSFKILRLTFSSKLDWSFYITSIASSMNFLSPEVGLYFCKSTIW